MRDDKTGAAVLVSGTSTGIGAASALHLSRLGYHVFACVRREAGAGPLLATARGGALTPVVLDVTDAAALDAAVARVRALLAERGMALVGILSNAGAGMMVPVEFLFEDVLRAQLELNLVGHMALVRRFLPLVREAASGPGAPQRGRIYFVGTGAGVPSPIFPFLGAYMASKWGLEALCRSLRMELCLRGDPVDVGMINPGFVHTRMRETTRAAVAPVLERLPAWARQSYGPFLAKFGAYADRQRGSSAERVAEAVGQAMTSSRPRRRYLVGWDSRRTAWLARLPLALQERLLARVYR
ncbi:MAG: SDR family NAD(P)-dependent oxidoreductase [Deltaproteobacteria bacterium]|nr:SDR family NAD(P)-dependent oxidoreductase [Deltaproteobacteria bacterium]